jgi:hypothetical protein
MKIRDTMYRHTHPEVAVHSGLVMSDQFAIVVMTSTFKMAYRKLSNEVRPSPGFGLQTGTSKRAAVQRASTETNNAEHTRMHG